MTTENRNRQGPSRRAMLAGTAAAIVAGAVSPAVAIPKGGDRKLLAMVARWRDLRDQYAAYEAERDRRKATMPASVREPVYPVYTNPHTGERVPLRTGHMIRLAYQTPGWPSEWPSDHPGRAMLAEIERIDAEQRVWSKRLDMDGLYDAIAPVMDAKADTEVAIMETPAQTVEGFRAKLEVYRHWADYMNEIYEPALPVLLDECARLIGVTPTY